jgi:hypothetical protein
MKMNIPLKKQPLAQEIGYRTLASGDTCCKRNGVQGPPLVYGAHCESRGSGSIPEKGHSRILAMSSAFVPDFVKPFLVHISTNSAFVMLFSSSSGGI